MRGYAALLISLTLFTGHHPHAQTVRVVTSCGSISPFPALNPGSLAFPTVDQNGMLCGGGGGGGSGSSVGPTGSAVPGSATYFGMNVAGTLTGVTGTSFGINVDTPIGSNLLNTLKPTVGTGSYTAATIGVSDSTILAASTATVFLDLVNLSPGATVCINPGATATISGTTCAAGEIALPPLGHRSWETNFIPTDAIHAIASAASTPFSVGVK